MDPASVKKLKVQVKPACMHGKTKTTRDDGSFVLLQEPDHLPPASRDEQIGDHEGSSMPLLATQELKDALSERGLDTTGLKPVLVDRLESALRAEQPNGAAAPNGTAKAAEEPLVDVTAPETTAAGAHDSAPASAVRTVRVIPGVAGQDVPSLTVGN